MRDCQKTNRRNTYQKSISMRSIISILALSMISVICSAQDFEHEFKKHLRAEDTAKQLEVLNKWEAQEPENAELFTSYFNYYFQKSRQEVVSLTQEQPEGKGFSIEDSTGATKGFIGSRVIYNKQIFEQGINKINRGISLYPNRLDMRFGKIFVFGQIEEWQRFTNEILKTIRYSAENNNQWTWTHHKPKENGKTFFLSSLQDYQLILYNTGDDKLLSNMQQIAEEVLKFYPEHVESLSNLSVIYLLNEEYDKAIQKLITAEQIAPEDPVILSNLAHVYKQNGNNEKALEYYQKIVKFGDEKTMEFAKEQIKRLQP